MIVETEVKLKLTKEEKRQYNVMFTHDVQEVIDEIEKIMNKAFIFGRSYQKEHGDTPPEEIYL